MSLEDRVRALEERLNHLGDEVKELNSKIAEISAKMDLLQSQNDKMFNLMKWVLFICLGIIGAIVGFKVVPPP